MRCFEKRSGTARPSFAFFFGGFFQVGDVRAGLREDVVQIVTYADEGETFVEKFADTRCAEEKESEDDIIFARGLDEALRGGI